MSFSTTGTTCRSFEPILFCVSSVGEHMGEFKCLDLKDETDRFVLFMLNAKVEGVSGWGWLTAGR